MPADPRPGSTDWLAGHWPPALVWAAHRLRPLARAHVHRHGWDGYCSACLLAAVEAWDVWEPARGGFDALVLLAARSRLWGEIKHLIRRPAAAPLGDRDVTDPHKGLPVVDLRDAAEACVRLAPRAADTLAAVAGSDTLTAAARRLGVSRQTVHARLSTVRDELAGRIGYAEPDVDRDPRGDAIATR